MILTALLRRKKYYFDLDYVGCLVSSGLFKLSYESDVVVHIVKYSTQAIKFYKKFGFTDTGKRFTEECYCMLIPKILTP